MKRERKEELFKSFPSVPEKYMAQMKQSKKRTAENFVIFLTRGNELFARCYHKFYDGSLEERQRYVFAKDGCFRCGVDKNGVWTIRREFREPIFCLSSYGYNFDNSYSVINMNAVKKSCMKYSGIEYYNGQLPIEYLRLYIQHPNIEYLMKSGYVHEIEAEQHYSYYWNVRENLVVNKNINLKSNNLLKMLGLNRVEFKTLSGHEIYYNSYVSWRGEFPGYAPAELLMIARKIGDQHGTAQRLSEQTGKSIKRISRYLDENNIYLKDYEDYINQCVILEYNLRDTAICFPRNFVAMHARLSSYISYNHDMIVQKHFEERYESRKALEFRSGDYLIRQPKSIGEIKDEGKKLSHCVAGYAQRHADGILHILFIRKAESPDVPLYTMELSETGRIIQVRGFSNSEPTDDAWAFIEEYKQYIEPLFDKRQKVRITA